MSNDNIFNASRKGDLIRIKFLIGNEGIDINSQDEVKMRKNFPFKFYLLFFRQDNLHFILVLIMVI